MAKPKTQQGETFNNIYELLEWIDRGFWVRLNHKSYHPSCVHNWPLRLIRILISRGELLECLDLEGSPYFSSLMVQVAATDLELSDLDRQMIEESAAERREVARHFLSNKRGSQWHV